MSPSNEAGQFRSDAEMLAVVADRANQARARQRRRQRVLAAGLAVLATVVLGTSIVVALRGGDDAPPADRIDADRPGVGLTDETNEDRPEGWTPMAESPLSPRGNVVSAWTGTELLVWGGEGETTDVCRPADDGFFLCGEPARSDGAAYDPATDTWRMMAESPLPAELGSWFRYEGVWTGTELVVWGGPEGKGAAYDPQTDSWRSIAEGPLGPRSRFTMTWTGDEVIVAGGSPTGDESFAVKYVQSSPVVAYDPVADAWRDLPMVENRNWIVAVATTDRLVIAGESSTQDASFAVLLDLDDPGAAWTDAGGPSLTQMRAGVWTGSSVLIAGSEVTTDPVSGEVVYPLVPRLAAVNPKEGTLTDLGAVPDGREIDRLLWTGDVALALSASTLPAGGGLVVWAVDPEEATWRALPDSGLEDVEGAAVAWTGEELLVWGGAWFHGLGSEPKAAGARYAPGPGGFDSDPGTSEPESAELQPEAEPSGEWMSMAESPLSPRVDAVSAWTGTELLVWGGEGGTSDWCEPQEDGSTSCGEPVRRDGAAYDPATDTWRPMAESPLDLEMGSSFNVRGVWTGDEMVVWGGRHVEGAAYDPVADAWRTIARAPIGWRERFEVVWTGDEMVVVGGGAWGSEQTMPVEVAAYSPDTDSWRRLPDLPEGRVDPVVTVVDGRVVVLGGYLEQTIDAEGNERRPSAALLDGDRWVDIGDPLVGRATAAVWTGDRLVVSGAATYDPASTEPVASSYDPDAGAWSRLPDPDGRVHGWRLVWTGADVMLLPASDMGMSYGPIEIQAIALAGSNRWRTLPLVGSETVQGGAVAWTGTSLILWGGAIQGGYGNDLRDASGVYTPGPGR